MKNIAKWFKASVLAMSFLCVCNSADAREKLVEKPSEPSTPAKEASLSDDKALSLHTDAVYKSIDFGKRKINKEVFAKAYHGFLNLKQSGQLDNKREILSICDFSLSANVPRLWVIDIKNRKVLFNTLVAHGQGSGEEFATQFSNIEGSHQSSMGFFVTANTYYGDKGYSLKLEGKDVGYNCQAYSRAIVIHAADYVSYDFIRANKRLGRSWGCPALPVELNRPIIDAIKSGTALYIHTENKKYIASSKWLKRYPNIDASEKTKMSDNTMLAELAEPSLNVDSVSKPVVPKIKPKPVPQPIPAEAYFN